MPRYCRYTTVIPAYSFGFGLSYSSWDYSSPVPLLTPSHFPASPPAGANITIRFELGNDGMWPGQETVQVYSSYSPLTAPTAVQSIPRTELKAFLKVDRHAWESRRVTMQLNVSSLALVGPDGKLAVQPGVYLIHVGGAAPGSRGVLVDGQQQHGRVVRQPMPSELLAAGTACHAARQWWEARLEGETGMAAVWVDEAIAGGLVGVLTIC